MSNKAMEIHLGNLSRLCGRDVTNKYSYIVTQDDLTNAYLKMRNDLGYPLMVDSLHRRAIVYNKQGLEKRIADMVNECILSNINELENMIVDDLSNDIESMLNGIKQASNGVITLGSKRSGNNSMTNKFANALAKGLVKGVGSIIDDITNPKEDRKR